ncbi:MAG: hypothetical protein WDZ65_13980 [Aquisalimonadaceae bacterium]
MLEMSRFELAERFRRTIYQICDALAQRYRSAALPLDETASHQAFLVSRLYGELAVSYKLGINDALARTPMPADTRLTLQTAIQRAILAHGRGLLEAYQTYSPEPAQVWRAVHMLYRNAELLRLQAQPIEGTRDTEETALSIKQAYLRMVTLALCNPYHLMQGDAEELYRRIGRWVHFVRVHAPEPESSLDGLFIVDLNSDLPPRYVSEQHRLPPPMNPRVFDFRELIRALTAHIENLNQTLQQQHNRAVLSERMQRDMYARTHQALAGRQERRSPRRPAVARVRMVDGLPACHYFMNGQRAFQPEKDEQRWLERLGVVGTGEQSRKLALAVSNAYLATHAPQSSRYSSHGNQATELDENWNDDFAEAPATERGSTEPELRSMIWNRKNESDGGMALFCPRNSGIRTRVGELVAYHDSAINLEPSSGDWKLGVIRWLRTRKQGGVELGIQHLADSGHAAGSKAVMGTGKGSAYVRTLVLPRVNPMTHAATLITPSGIYDAGTVLTLNLGKLVLYVELTELLETTRFYTHFRFRLRQAPTTPRAR